MLIKVVNKIGRVIEIDHVDTTDTILHIKKRFSLMEGIPPCVQRYIDLYGRFFKDSQTVEELSLRDGFEIYLVNANQTLCI